MNSTFIEIAADKFHEFLIENLPKHQASANLVSELAHQRFHSMSSFKKNFINEILNNYYGIHYVGMANISLKDNFFTYQLSVTDRNLCTFFLLKYGS
jgi:hypothetical protein